MFCAFADGVALSEDMGSAVPWFRSAAKAFGNCPGDKATELTGNCPRCCDEAAESIGFIGADPTSSVRIALKSCAGDADEVVDWAGPWSWVFSKDVTGAFGVGAFKAIKLS